METTYLEEFEEQWTSLCNYLDSEMIKSTRNRGLIDLQNINGLFKNELKRWKLPGQYQNAWLEKLRRDNPQVAQQFEEALMDVRLEQIQPSPQPSAGAYVAGPAAGGAVIGFAVTRLLGAVTPITVIGTVALGAVGAFAGNGTVNNKKKEALDKDRGVYVKQLKQAGKALGEIVKQADKN